MTGSWSEGEFAAEPVEPVVAFIVDRLTTRSRWAARMMEPDTFYPGRTDPEIPTASEAPLVHAECRAAFRIVEIHAPRRRGFVNLTVDDSLDDAAAKLTDESLVCECCAVKGEHVDFPCPTLRALASVYAGHSEYRAEWAL